MLVPQYANIAGNGLPHCWQLPGVWLSTKLFMSQLGNLGSVDSANSLPLGKYWDTGVNNNRYAGFQVNETVPERVSETELCLSTS